MGRTLLRESVNNSGYQKAAKDSDVAPNTLLNILTRDKHVSGKTVMKIASYINRAPKDICVIN